jgi:hypothetical protein
MRIALVWRGNPHVVPLEFPRLQPIYDALMRIGVAPIPIAFSEASVDEARVQLLSCDGVLSWVDPLTDGVDRTKFDALLRDVSAQGVWVSAHPDVILKMGVKEVLVRTKGLGWGTDVYAYDSIEVFHLGFPARLAADRVRVLKQNRGNSNQGVWKVELENPLEPIGPDTRVTVLEAREDFAQPGVRLSEFMSRCDRYLTRGGHLIDQAFQQRVDDGLVRCYMCQDKVIGFSEQFPRNRALGDLSLPAFAMARDKTMHDEAAPRFQGLRDCMESDWTPGLQALLGIERSELPVLWDADFLYGPKTPDGEDSFVLCEINVSCVVPYPLTAVETIASAGKEGIAAFRASAMRTTQQADSY